MSSLSEEATQEIDSQADNLKSKTDQGTLEDRLSAACREGSNAITENSGPDYEKSSSKAKGLDHSGKEVTPEGQMVQCSSHEENELDGHCERIELLQDGRAQQGTKTEPREVPRTISELSNRQFGIYQRKIKELANLRVLPVVEHVNLLVYSSNCGCKKTSTNIPPPSPPPAPPAAQPPKANPAGASCTCDKTDEKKCLCNPCSDPSKKPVNLCDCKECECNPCRSKPSK